MPLIIDPDGLSQGGETAVSDAVFQNSVADATEIASAGAELPAVTVGDYIEVRDHTVSGNNGLYIVTGTPTTSLIALTKQALTDAVVNPVDSASEAIRTLGTNANEKNIHFDPALKRFTLLNGFGSVSTLDNDGVLMQTLYSFMKEEWKNDNDLIKFSFPAVMITPEQLEFVEGWKPTDEAESTIATTNPSNTRQLIRTGGWREVDIDDFVEQEYFGVITLGTIDTGDTAYYFFDGQSAATSYTFDGAVNEAVRSIERVDLSADGPIGFDDNNTISRTTGSWITDGFVVGDRILIQNAEDAANNGSFEVTVVTALTLDVTGTPFTVNADDTTALMAIDRRQSPFTTRIRVFGKTFDASTTDAIGVSTLTFQVYRFPLSEVADAVINDLVTSTVGDLFIDIITTPIAPYNDMTIAYFATAQDRSGFNAIGGDTPSPGDAQFGIIVDGDVSVIQEDGGGVASAEEIYAFVQARLVGSADINDGSGAAAVVVNGQLAQELLAIASTGNTLSTIFQTNNPGGDGNGVYIDSFDSNDKNRVQFEDNDDDTRTFPFVATGSILFNANLSTDVDAVYRMFFTNDDAGDNTGRDFGTINAITVDNAAAVDIAGAVPQAGGGSSAGFDFDYDGNAQRGTGSEGTDAPITIVAIGLSTGQYVIATGTITRAENQTFSLVAALERNFSNPV